VVIGGISILGCRVSDVVLFDSRFDTLDLRFAAVVSSVPG
jgi:hypothetical protein